MKVCLISTSTFPSDQGIRTLSACLERAGHEVLIIFLPLVEDYMRRYAPQELEEIFKYAKNYDLVGIGSMESTTGRAKQLIDLFQKNNIPIVWGGPHPTFFPEKCFKMCNLICVGEAEDAIVELADTMDKKEDISKLKNFWVRKDGQEYTNPVRAPPNDLDVLAMPDFDIEDQLILERGKLIPFEERHFAGMLFFQTERGCPQACSYCTNNILRALYEDKADLLRTHSVDYVITFLKSIKERFPSIQTIDIRDETITVRKTQWLREFSKRYREEVGIRMKCLAEPATMAFGEVSDEKIRLLVEAGLTDIIIGIQSGSDRLNKEIYNRFITQKHVLECAKIVNKYKDRLTVMYDIISCNPYENNEDILDTIRLLQKIPKPYFLSVNNLIFFEGTPLYKKAMEDGLIKTYNDTAGNLNYWDRWKHIKLKKKNPYLNLVLNMMRGSVTNRRYGLLPKFFVDWLTSRKVVAYNIENERPTYTAGAVVEVMDNTREKLIKPTFRAMPVGVKTFYDKVRYKM
jgi:anaerobic magnesium-protoporphyrin IX monomethyl ester cyclase